MNDYTCWKIGNRYLEFYDDGHLYFVDGIQVPSVSDILKFAFPDEYKGIDPAILEKAANAGTAVHEAIESWCKHQGKFDDVIRQSLEDKYPEVRSFKTLKRLYKFDVLANELPVIVEDKGGDVVAAGRLDLVLEIDGKTGGGDIKRTSSVNKEKFAYQLNIYRLAFERCYGVKWDFLRVVHVRNDVRQFIELPIKEDATWELIEEFKNAR